MIPRTREELMSVGTMMLDWTRHSNGWWVVRGITPAAP
jgi:hypothetical protein